jgi:hypothetical protein
VADLLAKVSTIKGLLALLSAARVRILALNVGDQLFAAVAETIDDLKAGRTDTIMTV